MMALKKKIERLEREAGDNDSFILVHVGEDGVYWMDAPEQRETTQAELEALGEDTQVVVFRSNVDFSKV